MTGWSGRKVRRLVDLTLATKGTTCHLCGLGGADSADHNPPRSVLVAMGVDDPDDLAFLHPSHRRPCNITRQARDITDALRVELRAKREAYVQRLAQRASLSPRFLTATAQEAPRPLPVYPPSPPQKTGGVPR